MGDFDPRHYLENKQLEYMDRFAQFALIAAREAFRDANIHDLTDEQRNRFGVVMGSSGGGQGTIDDAFVELYRHHKPRVHPLTIPRVMANAGASHIATDLGITGPCYAVSTACSSANHAIGQGFWLIRSGVIDGAIVGGSEAPLSLGNLKAWEALRVVSPDLCRPFSRDRNGIILGEGAGVLILESLRHARARGAHIYAELAGFGMSADAAHVIQPDSDGAARAMQAALHDAEMCPEDIDYINAHGTGTTVNDLTETVSIRKVFGRHADKLLISSTKSMHGHALGAAGALESVAVALSLQDGLVPPTANFTEADPACDLDVVPNQARRADIRCAVSNSFAFGGLNAVLAFRRWEHETD
ncbi:MAG: beta-ketoacyl-[acyl-carrier-protein] synthase family protein [Gammaproteobacteria bacterium]|nr:beta-ketoacyl-[acyl-carrier-protein] synthase family protein [Gammaproteobacteria bacterium]